MQRHLCDLLSFNLQRSSYNKRDCKSRCEDGLEMNALRQCTRLLRHRPLQQIRAAHQDTSAQDFQRKVDGEIGIASGAPEEIYKRQVLSRPSELTLVGDDYARKPFSRQFVAGKVVSSLWGLQVIIYAPARTAGQQGKAQTSTNAGNGPAWKLIFDTQQK